MSDIGDVGFYELMKIANPEIDKELNQYPFEWQLIVSQFTRIFNIEQILYILNRYKPEVEGIQPFTCMLSKGLDTLKNEFGRNYGWQHFNNLDVYTLLELEMDKMFPSETCMKRKMYKICLNACMIEKEFQYRNFKFKALAIQGAKGLPVWKKRKTEQYKKMARNKKIIWKKFEGNFQQFIGMEMKNVQEGDGIRLFVKEKDITPVEVTTIGMKNTFSFYRYMQKNQNTQASKNFMALFLPYAKDNDMIHANFAIVSGHIQYFRILNIIKMMYLCEQFHINCQYDGIDITDILMNPVEAAAHSMPGLIEIEEEMLCHTINRDLYFLSGIYGEMETHTEMMPFLFASYLDIERTWLSFDALKLNAAVIDMQDKAVAKMLADDAIILNKYFNGFCQEAKYDETINELEGKIIVFPSQV